MAALLKGFLQANQPEASPVPAGDSDFADFAGAPDPAPASISASAPSAASNFFGAPRATGDVPWTKWYNIHERHSLSDFKQEGVILIAVFFIVLIHLWGTRVNRAKAKAWISAHAPALRSEFALVGFGGPKRPTADKVQSDGLLHSMASDAIEAPEELLKEKASYEFSTYATGRQNVAFMDVHLTMLKRYSPLSLVSEFVLGFFFESMAAPEERMEALLYPFDGKEGLTVPGQLPGAVELKVKEKSTYDGFVWAIVNKDKMKQLRDERYDVSITSTKDHPKLPIWATVMSESAEITETLLTPELIKAVEQCGEELDHLIITDQPIDRPTSLKETEPKKRLYLSMRLPSSPAKYNDSMPLFSYFLRLPDLLVQSAHFRPEILRKVRTVREDMIRSLKKESEKEKAEERELERERAKKLKRDLELKGLDAKAQKKYLDKEREREQKRAMKKQTMRG